MEPSAWVKWRAVKSRVTSGDGAVDSSHLAAVDLIRIRKWTGLAREE